MIRKVFLFFFMACLVAFGRLACGAYAGNGIELIPDFQERADREAIRKIEKSDNYLHGPWLEKKSEKIAVRISWREGHQTDWDSLNRYLNIAERLNNESWRPVGFKMPEGRIAVKIYLNEPGSTGRPPRTKIYSSGHFLEATLEGDISNALAPAAYFEQVLSCLRGLGENTGLKD